MSKAQKAPLTSDTIYRQLNKLNDTPFYIENISFNIEEDLFLSLSEINDLRRRLIEYIYSKEKINRAHPKRIALYLKKRLNISANTFIARVETLEQYNACKEMGIETIFFKNVSPYVNSKYEDIDEDEVLVSNYGGLYHYTNKITTTDYSFNVMNKDSVLYLLNLGAANVTLSCEMSYDEIKNLSNDFHDTYGAKAPLDMIIYGKQKLMTMKYCPLKQLSLCGKCKNNQYYLVDKLGKFLIKTKKDCFVEIYNDLPLNLIEELSKLSPYINRFRFEFTNESASEVIDIVKNAYAAIEDSKHKYRRDRQTKGYFKRSII